eukprot:gene14195-biopygen17088
MRHEPPLPPLALPVLAPSRRVREEAQRETRKTVGKRTQAHMRGLAGAVEPALASLCSSPSAALRARWELGSLAGSCGSLGAATAELMEAASQWTGGGVRVQVVALYSKES